MVTGPRVSIQTTNKKKMCWTKRVQLKSIRATRIQYNRQFQSESIIFVREP